MTEECLAAVSQGMNMHGTCLYPAVDMRDWHTGEWLHKGLCDLEPEVGDLLRVPKGTHVQELRRWQTLLKRVTQLDDDPFSGPVSQNDMVEAARR